LYELVTGRCPYGSQPTADDIKNKNVGPLEDVVERDIPAALQILLEEMLDKSAAGRPSAESVAARLSEMGFPPGAVSRRLLPTRARVVDDSILESVAPIQATRLVPKPDLPRKDPKSSTGISARTTIIALSVMLVVLVGVVFVLPRILTKQQTESPATAAVNQAPSAASDQGAAKADGFSENVTARGNKPGSKQEADESLGELLSKLERLELRAVDRWAGQAFRLAQDKYAEGDKAYLNDDYANANARYQETISALNPLLQKVDEVYADTLEQAETALLSGQSLDAVRLYELAVAMSPGDQSAVDGLQRARNLDTVMSLTRQSLEFERDEDLQGARQAIEKALDLDPQWQPAIDIAERINAAIVDWTFAERMSEGFNALSLDDFASARAAFTVAQEIKPASTEPRDGLLQVEQNIRLARIASLSSEADALVRQERWEEAVSVYKSILDIESNLDLATSGLAAANERVNMHNTLGRYIADPDSLSEPATLQSATLLLLQIARMRDVGPRLEGQKNELSKLLKRATTELEVQLLSDNATEVAVYRVGKLGSFESRELKLRPGTYVAVGSRPGYRDVRLEFRVAPELDPQPVVVRCEEKI
jgi:tetratricopeptide (TPR) repeat protein